MNTIHFGVPDQAGSPNNMYNLDNVLLAENLYTCTCKSVRSYTQPSLYMYIMA
jgi:hypothetical protein